MDLQPIKLEQPYSVIRMRNDGDDPNKLGSWERPPHNSSKITKQNLDDAMAVNNVFKDSIDSGNSLQAPEGNNNDYFLKAKNNLVSKTNDRKIGEFLNQFHGMDFFKRGVPEIEKGLKGTGYDMGPSVSIKENLEEAVDKGDSKEVENIIEEHPVESQEILPEDTPIQEEAEQITEDTNKANDEVNNEVVEDFVNENKRFKDIENKPYYEDWVNSEPGSEQFMNAYNSVVNDYGKEEADEQLKSWGIELPKDEEDDFEAYAKQAGEEAGDRKQLEKEHAKAFDEKLKHNNQQAWKDYALEKSKLNTRGSIRKGFENEVGKSILAEIMTPEEWMNDSLREGVLRHTTYTSNPVEVRNRLRESIAKEKKALGINEETLKANAKASAKANAEEEKKGSIDWDKVKVYEPNEDPYFKVIDESDWKNNPDHEPDFIEIKDKKDDYQKDEDFLGPDEYIDENGNIQVDPNWKPENADEDFVGPDEQLAVINSGLPAETEPVYDTSDYNFDWDYDIQTLGVKSPEEIPDAPVENVEQAKAKQRLMKWLKSHGHSYRMSEPENDMSSREEIHNNYRNGGRAAGSSLLGNIGRASGLSYNAPNVHSLSKEDKHGGPSNSTASGSTELPNSEKPTERTMSLSTINSGETMFGKSGMLGRADLNKGGEIKVGQSGIKADFTGHTSKPEELAPKPMGGSANASNGIYTDLITQILRKFPNGYSDNQITITVNGQNVLVNGKQLNQLSDIEIQTLKEIL